MCNSHKYDHFAAPSVASMHTVEWQDDWFILNCLKGSGRTVVEALAWHLPGGAWEKESNFSQCVGVPAGIRTKRLPNTSLESQRYTSHRVSWLVRWLVSSLDSNRPCSYLSHLRGPCRVSQALVWDFTQDLQRTLSLAYWRYFETVIMKSGNDTFYSAMRQVDTWLLLHLCGDRMSDTPASS